MRVSRFPLLTVKETPADAEIISHKLMLKAGIIRKLAAGLYTWTNTGLIVLRKVENIVREEMNRAGAVELLMPTVLPTELWDESGRLSQYGPELLRFNDRHNREFCYGPTHEEIITDFVRKEIKSHKQLPLNLYQINTKFRDEIRPRFGVMRAREFLMKDAYSFHNTYDCLDQEYENIYQAYSRMFERMGLKFRAVDADTGSIGGNTSHEFHVLADSGEDAIAFSDSGEFAANVELAEAVMPKQEVAEPGEEAKTVDTPNQHTIEDVSEFFSVSPDKILKTIIVLGEGTPLVALALRGDHDLNEVKAAKIEGVASPLKFAANKDIEEIIGCGVGSIGVVGLDIPVIVDRSAAVMSDFICGANLDGKHMTGVNWSRDAVPTRIEDIRKVQDGDQSPDGNGTLSIARGIEVGHIFKLGTKYSEAMGATVQDEDGQARTIIMGTYGIGVSRIVAAAIEQNHDDNGIIWPDAIAPFNVALLPMNMHKSETVKKHAEELYVTLKQEGIDVILDDRKVRPGFMFADMELVGIPHRIVIGEKSIKNGVYEYKGRRDENSSNIEIENIVSFIKEQIKT